MFYTDDSFCCCILKHDLKDIDPKLNVDVGDFDLLQEYDLKYLLALINSKTLNFYFKIILGSGLNVYPENIEQLPIHYNPQNQQIFIDKTEEMLKYQSCLIKEVDSTKDWLRSQYNVTKFSKNLEKYYELELEEFLAELNNKKVNTKIKKKF
jgi:hypothetical protein